MVKALWQLKFFLADPCIQRFNTEKLFIYISNSYLRELSSHIRQTRRRTMLKILSNQSITSNVAHAKFSTDAPSGDANVRPTLRIIGERMRDAKINGGHISRSTVNRQRILVPGWSFFRTSLCFIFVFPAISSIIHAWHHSKLAESTCWSLSNDWRPRCQIQQENMMQLCLLFVSFIYGLLFSLNFMSLPCL